MAKLLDLSVYGPGHISNILQVDASVYAKAFVTDGGKDTQVVRGDGTLASISSLSVGNADTATNAPWSGITGKPTTFTPSAHTHTASDVSGLPTSLKNPYALTFGSKSYDGSAAATITASDLGALTAHQSIYALTLQVNGTSQGTYNPASAAKTINIAVPTKTSDITNDSGFITSAAIPTALKNPYAVEIKANGVSLGTYDGSAAATFNLSAANVGAANKVHSHYSIATEGDNRNVATSPNDYVNSFVFRGLKDNTIIGSPSSDIYSYLIGLRGWKENSGGNAHELAFNNSGIFRRQGSTTEWSSWYQLIDTGNFTKSLVEGVLTGNITSHTHSYLPLSGGTISGSGAELLKIDSSNQSYNAIIFKINGVAKSEFGFTVGKCSYIYDYTSSKYLGVDVSGTPFYGVLKETGKYTLLHSGNYNSYAPTLTGTGATGTWGISISGNAASANVVSKTYANQSINFATGESKIRLISNNDVNGGSNGFPAQYVGGISAISDYVGWQMMTDADNTVPNPFFRKVDGKNNWTTWKQLAFLTDNVASATKLQDNTAFTAWGQTFFENGKPKNVSDNLSMEWSKIYWNGDIEGSYISSHGMTEMTYEMRGGHSFYVNGDMKLRITRFGNVLIGTAADRDYKLQVNGSANATTLYENGTRVSLTGHTHTKSQITDFPSSMPASDVYSWAKASTKPTYTYSEVGAAAASHTHDNVYSKKYSYSLPPQKCVKIRYDSYTPVIISACRSNGRGQFLLAGLGYGEDGWTRNQFRCLIPSPYIAWKLSATACTVELYHNATSENVGDAIITVITTGNIIFTAANTLSGTEDTKRFACVDELTWDNIISKPTIPTNTNQLTNGAGFITGITKSMVTTALGYTPPTSDTNTWRPVTNTYTGSDQSTCVSQYGTNALYNALVNGYASSAGTATYATNDVDGSPFKTTYLRKVTVANNTENDFNSFSNMTLTGRGDPTTGASLKNAPWSGGGPAGGYGVLTYLWSSYGTQMAWGYASNRIYIRNKYYTGSASIWSSSWDSIALMSDIPTSLPASDVYSWAKASTKPTYTYSEVGAAAASHTHNYAGSSSVGGAATSVVVTDSNANSTYRMVWHSGNSLYSTNNIYCNPSTDSIYASAFYESSDERLKDFENEVNVDLNLIRSIPKMYFRWKKNPNKLQIGTSAQAVKKIYPELVTSSEDGILSVDYSKLSIVALSAIDKLHLENQDLKHEINLLKQEIEKLKGQI